jgi:uncharacterized phage protein (TIGR01671 family)
MRESLYRGKTQGSHKWVYGSLLVTKSVSTGKMLYRICPVDYDAMTETEVDHETISQYTGMIDTDSGDKIFEGDILQLISPHDNEEDWWDEKKHCGKMFEVKWIEEEARFDLPVYYLEDFAIQGNKWDNPELLEAQNA